MNTDVLGLSPATRRHPVSFDQVESVNASLGVRKNVRGGVESAARRLVDGFLKADFIRKPIAVEKRNVLPRPILPARPTLSPARERMSKMSEVVVVLPLEPVMQIILARV